MVYQVMLEKRDCCVGLEKYGSRMLAQQFIDKQPKAKRGKLSIREVTYADNSPAVNYPYHPGKGN